MTKVVEFREVNRTRVHDLIDVRGRTISKPEFNWLQGKFRSRYSPHRLCFCLLFQAGLRLEDAVNARLTWFSRDFTRMRMSQCKPSVRLKDGEMVIKTKPREVPLSPWFSADLKGFVKNRLFIGEFVGRDNIEEMRMWPTVSKQSMWNWMAKIRKRYGKEQPWLNDLWKITRVYNKDGILTKVMKWHRVSYHAGRAFYATAAYQATGQDLQATRMLTGHERTKDLDRYIKTENLVENKSRIRQEHLDNLAQPQLTELLPGQKRLDKFT